MVRGEVWRANSDVPVVLKLLKEEVKGGFNFECTNPRFILCDFAFFTGLAVHLFWILM
jgi:hypothetical protein